jgi:hypothetical protein
MLVEPPTFEGAQEGRTPAPAAGKKGRAAVRAEPLPLYTEAGGEDNERDGLSPIFHVH